MAKKLIDPAVIGKKGGKARARVLTPEELSEQGRKAVQERWRRYREAKAKGEAAGARGRKKSK
jgi:hypothetical protein